jgi:hypothetical protein
MAGKNGTSGNSRLTGGPEDGIEVEVAWPPSPILSRTFEGRIHHYELQDDVADDGRMVWQHAGSEAVVEPGSKQDKAVDDPDAESAKTGTRTRPAPRPAPRRSGSRG